ncbi:hypothetical protein V6N13_055441 [Hibiscus sabdariffa]
MIQRCSPAAAVTINATRIRGSASAVSSSDKSVQSDSTRIVQLIQDPDADKSSLSENKQIIQFSSANKSADIVNGIEIIFESPGAGLR